MTRFFRLAQTTKVMLAVAIYITHPLQMYVAIDIIWNEYLKTKFEKSRYQLFYEYAVRTLLVLLTCKKFKKIVWLFLVIFLCFSCLSCRHSKIGSLYISIWCFLSISFRSGIPSNHPNEYILVLFNRNKRKINNIEEFFYCYFWYNRTCSWNLHKFTTNC